MTCNIRSLASGFLWLVFAAGCSDGYRAIDMQGSVRVDGTPASAGHIVFVPSEDGKGSGGMCRIQEDGSYPLRKVPVGSVTFTIAPEERTGRQVETMDPGGNPVMVEELLPMTRADAAHGRGQAVVRLDVTSGMENHDFELTDE